MKNPRPLSCKEHAIGIEYDIDYHATSVHIVNIVIVLHTPLT